MPSGIANGLFSSKSPIDMNKRREEPRRLRSKVAERIIKGLSNRLKRLLEARDEVNKVHSEGYFENHYPDADKELKGLLHDKVMTAHSRMRADDDYEEEDRKPSITIKIEQ